jgi:hypothetical protein
VSGLLRLPADRRAAAGGGGLRGRAPVPRTAWWTPSRSSASTPSCRRRCARPGATTPTCGTWCTRRWRRAAGPTAALPRPAAARPTARRPRAAAPSGRRPPRRSARRSTRLGAKDVYRPAVGPGAGCVFEREEQDLEHRALPRGGGPLHRH